MSLPSIEEMFKAGVHLGHKKEYTHPRSKKNIFSIKNRIYIIDLEKTLEYLEKALKYLQDQSKKGKTILLVGSKKQSQNAIKEAGIKSGMPFIANRWIGGALTNFSTLQKNLKHLEELDAKIASADFNSIIKKEKAMIQKERDRLFSKLEGLKNLRKLPDVMFIVDTRYEKNAVREAMQSNIPVVGICDTDSNPDSIDFPIPANDDAQKSIEMIVGLIAEVIINARTEASEVQTKTKADEKPIEEVIDSEIAKELENEIIEKDSSTDN